MADVPLIITGLGMLNALGLGRALYWQELLSGRHGIAPVENFEPTARASNLGAQIRGFEAKAWMPGRFYRRLSRLSRLAVAASIEALADSGLVAAAENRQRLGCVFGSAFGSTEHTDAFFVSVLEHGPAAAEPILFPDTVPNAPASHVAIFHGLQGPNSTICQNYLSGECALAFAAALLEQGRADALLVGGADELSAILLHSLGALGALQARPEGAAFDPGRLTAGRGFIPGEAVTCLVLEREDAARSRGQKACGKLLAVVCAGASAKQGHYAAAVEALAGPLLEALAEARLGPEAIDIIGLAANGVGELEAAEAAALEQVFGSGWQQIPRVPLRYFVGEFGAAGLLNVATIVLALRDGMVPPAIHGPRLTGTPGDPRRFTPARKADLRYGLTIGSTFGGGNSCVIVGRGDSP
jgi:3-oxoacyl-(acyl-carrier-protein) synthase